MGAHGSNSTKKRPNPVKKCVVAQGDQAVDADAPNAASILNCQNPRLGCGFFYARNAMLCAQSDVVSEFCLAGNPVLTDWLIQPGQILAICECGDDDVVFNGFPTRGL